MHDRVVRKHANLPAVREHANLPVVREHANLPVVREHANLPVLREHAIGSTAADLVLDTERTRSIVRRAPRRRRSRAYPGRMRRVPLGERGSVRQARFACDGEGRGRQKVQGDRVAPRPRLPG
jgi:hypothetical protein